MRSRLSSEDGAILIQVALAILVLIAFNIFVVDYGVMWAGRAQAQNAGCCPSSSACTSRGTMTGSRAFLSAFWRKMSAKEVLITARKPYWVSAQGACS